MKGFKSNLMPADSLVKIKSRGLSIPADVIIHLDVETFSERSNGNDVCHLILHMCALFTMTFIIKHTSKMTACMFICIHNTKRLLCMAVWPLFHISLSFPWQLNSWRRQSCVAWTLILCSTIWYMKATIRGMWGRTNEEHNLELFNRESWQNALFNE